MIKNFHGKNRIFIFLTTIPFASVETHLSFSRNINLACSTSWIELRKEDWIENLISFQRLYLSHSHIPADDKYLSLFQFSTSRISHARFLHSTFRVSRWWKAFKKIESKDFILNFIPRRCHRHSSFPPTQRVTNLLWWFKMNVGVEMSRHNIEDNWEWSREQDEKLGKLWLIKKSFFPLSTEQWTWWTLQLSGRCGDGKRLS